MEKIKELVREGSAYRDFIVLYRTNAQSRVLRRRLPRRGHPLSRRRRRRFLRADRDQGHDLVPALPREPVRCGRVPAHRQRAAPQRSASRRSRACIEAANVCRRLGRQDDLRLATCSSAPFRRSSASSSASPSLITDLRERPRRCRSPTCWSRSWKSRATCANSRPRTRPTRRTRLENLQELVTRRARVRSDREDAGSLGDFLANVALISDLDSLYRRLVVRHADDDALGEGSRVPGRLHDRSRRGRLPAQPRADRHERTRRRTPSRVRRRDARDGPPLLLVRAAAHAHGQHVRPSAVALLG